MTFVPVLFMPERTTGCSMPSERIMGLSLRIYSWADFPEADRSGSDLEGFDEPELHPSVLETVWPTWETSSITMSGTRCW